MPKWEVEVYEEVRTSHRMVVEADSEKEAKNYALKNYYMDDDVESVVDHTNLEILECELLEE